MALQPVLSTDLVNDGRAKFNSNDSYLDQRITDLLSNGSKGSIIITGSGTTWTIGDGSVTLAMMANLAANSIIGNNTGSAGVPIALTATQTKTLLSLNNVENTALSSWTGSSGITRVGTLASGIVPWNLITSKPTTLAGYGITDGAISAPTILIGDVTGSGIGTFTTTIANSGVTLAKMAALANGTFIGRHSAGTGAPEAVSLANLKSDLSLNLVENTALSTWAGSTNITTLGTIATGTVPWARLSSTPTTHAGYGITDTSTSLTGDVTGSGTASFATTIANGAVSLAKMANMATASILGRNTGGTGSPEVLSAATTKSLLSLNNVENTALSTWAGTTNITTLGTISTGTVPWARVSSTPTTLAGYGITDGGSNVSIQLSGDVTASGIGSVVTTIASGVVTLTKMANIATASILGRNTAGTGSPEVLSVATIKTLLSISNVENTALSTWAGSANITTLGTISSGSVPWARVSSTPTTLAGYGITDGGIGNSTIVLTGDVTASGVGSVTTTIASGVVTLTKMANMATASLIGRNTAGTGSPEVLSAATTKTLLSLNNVENTAVSTWAGSSNLTTLGTITTGTWAAVTIPVNRGGTGQVTYTDGQLLIGGGGTLVKGTLTGTASELTVTNASGVITLSLPDVYGEVELQAGLFINSAGDLTAASGLIGDVDTTNDFTLDQQEFAASGLNYISGTVHMPPDWDGTTAPKFKILSYSTGSHASQTARLGITCGYIRPGTDSWITALGTTVYNNQTYTSANVIQLSSAFAPTPAGTAASGAQLKIRVVRDGSDVSNDTFISPTRLVKVIMQYKKTIYGNTTVW